MTSRSKTNVNAQRQPTIGADADFGYDFRLTNHMNQKQ